jgi:micrococcal nuclease
MLVARHVRRRLLILSVSTLGFFISSFSVVLASDFTAPVISVLDGDTIEVLHNHHPERIRLNGIDCPEKGQAYGNNAKHAASELVFGKEVTLQTYGLDKYGRTLADVRLSDGTNVNHTLVKDGWCWWYRKHAPADTVLERLENEAREAKKGLWVDPAPVPPGSGGRSSRRSGSVLLENPVYLSLRQLRCLLDLLESDSQGC